MKKRFSGRGCVKGRGENSDSKLIQNKQNKQQTLPFPVLVLEAIRRVKIKEKINLRKKKSRNTSKHKGKANNGRKDERRRNPSNWRKL